MAHSLATVILTSAVLSPKNLNNTPIKYSKLNTRLKSLCTFLFSSILVIKFCNKLYLLRKLFFGSLSNDSITSLQRLVLCSMESESLENIFTLKSQSHSLINLLRHVFLLFVVRELIRMFLSQLLFFDCFIISQDFYYSLKGISFITYIIYFFNSWGWSANSLNSLKSSYKS